MKKTVILLILAVITCGAVYGENPIESEAYFIREMEHARGHLELLADVNNDGRDEFIYVKGKHVSVGSKKTKLVGRVYIYNFMKGKFISGLEWEHVDSEQADYIIREGKFVREWVSREFDDIKALAVGDANNNGRNEIIIATSSYICGYEKSGGGYYFLAYRLEVPNGKTKIFSLFTGDVDGDKKKEMIICEEVKRIEYTEGATVICKVLLLEWNGESFVKKWESETFESFRALPSVSIADVEGDDREEILVYSPEAYWTTGFLWKYDSKTKRYGREAIKEYIGKGADIDGDGNKELARDIFGEKHRIKKLELVKWKDGEIMVEKTIDMSIAPGLLGPIGYNVSGEKEVNIVIEREGEENYNVMYGAK